ncbi:MAG: hypothetical protein HZA94_00605 [Candidatus Vogelbacteria bacterium]|nr:hypothetical protein [Candidatus Vogelbacteria bacterium]
MGPRAVGKTFWIDYLLETYGSRLGRVKNTTTRAPRDERDHMSYNFISKKEFRNGLRGHRFL